MFQLNRTRVLTVQWLRIFLNLRLLICVPFAFHYVRAAEQLQNHVTLCVAAMELPVRTAYETATVQDR